MKKSLEVISLKENKIEYKIKVKRGGVLVPISLSFIVIVLLCFSFGGNVMQDIGQNVAYVFSPVNSLYNDNSGIVFTASGYVEKSKLDFIVPIKSSDVQSLGSEIHFNVTDSIMVMAIENGIVVDCGSSLDNKKFIKIRHSPDVESVIENVDILGVVVGDTVKKGQDIASAIVGEVLVLKIYEHGGLCSSLSVNQSRVIWKD